MKTPHNNIMKVATVALGISTATAAGTGPWLMQSLDCNDVNGKATPSLIVAGFLDKECKQGIPYNEEQGKAACIDMMKDDGRRMLHQHEKGEKKDGMDMDMKFKSCAPADKGGKMLLVMTGEGMDGKTCNDMKVMGTLFNASMAGVCADGSSECPPMQNQMFMGMNMGSKCTDVDGGVVLTMGGGMFMDKECKKVVPGMGQMLCMGMAKDMGGSGGMNGKKRRFLSEKKSGSGGMVGSGGMDKKEAGSGGMMGSGGMGKKTMEPGMKCMPSKDGNTMEISMMMPAKDIGGMKCSQLVPMMKQEKDKQKNMFEPQCNPNDLDMKEKQMMMLAKKCMTCEAEGKTGCGKIMNGGEPDKPKPKPGSASDKEDESGAMAFALGGLAVLAMLF